MTRNNVSISRTLRTIQRGVLLPLALGLAFAGCLDGAYEDDLEDLPVIQDKEIVLIEEGRIDPPVGAIQEDVETTTAMAISADYTADVPCVASNYCGCWDYRYVAPELIQGSCRWLTCENDSDCPQMEDCLGGICGNTCSQNSDCQTGQVCNGYKCENVEHGDYDYCRAGGCERGDGDCDSDSECTGSYLCYDNIGSQYGYASNVDVCLPPAGHADFCTDQYPCSVGQGDCDNNDQCEGFFNVCKNNIGAQFGMPSWVDVCQPLF